jgi:hypothetical protein
VQVDLGAALVIAGDQRGHTVRTRPYDPRHEIRVRSIDAGNYGNEWIEYLPTTTIENIYWLDVDVGAVSPDTRTKHWIRTTMPAEPSRW